MKRYEERLLEDEKSQLWKVLLSPYPPIHKLPNEVWLSILEFLVEDPNSISSLRLTAKRFRDIAGAVLFRRFDLASKPPSLICVLPALIKRNEYMANACSDLILHLNGYRTSRSSHPIGPPTHLYQDTAQSELLSGLPRLQSLTLILESITEDMNPQKNTGSHLGFPLTTAAISHCKQLRELTIQYRASSDDKACSELTTSLIAMVPTTVEKLSFVNMFLNLYSDFRLALERLVDRRGPLCHITVLTLDQFLDSDYRLVPSLLMSTFPSLKCLSLNAPTPRSLSPEPGSSMMNRHPLDVLRLSSLQRICAWMLLIPAMKLELEFVSHCYLAQTRCLFHILERNGEILRGNGLRRIWIRASRPTWSSLLDIAQWLSDDALALIRSCLASLPMQDPENDIRSTAKLLSQKKSIPIQFDIQDVPPTINYLVEISRQLDHIL